MSLEESIKKTFAKIDVNKDQQLSQGNNLWNKDLIRGNNYSTYPQLIAVAIAYGMPRNFLRRYKNPYLGKFEF